MRKVEINDKFFFVGSLNKHFWHVAELNKWERETFRLFDEKLNQETTFIDIGAWIGPTTLYAATIVSKVFALEPDPVAAEQLAHSISLNPDLSDKIAVLSKALSAQSGTKQMGSFAEKGDSMSSFVHKEVVESWPVECMTPSELLNMLLPSEKADIFFKIDIEGHEYELLKNGIEEFEKGAENRFCISFHTKFLKKAGIGRIERFKMHNRVFRALSGYKVYSVKKRRTRRERLVELFARWFFINGETNKTFYFEK